MSENKKQNREKGKKKEKENKRVRTGSFKFSQPWSEGDNHSQFHQNISALALFLASAPVPKF